MKICALKNTTTLFQTHNIKVNIDTLGLKGRNIHFAMCRYDPLMTRIRYKHLY